ncbi:hypothetical protein BJ085DRAFT_30446 [Dimargaris cristalligena]|uniref:F-box domain-containing protein n=1 Tax=Dimargaris cristalligena TaxID=215637 RepID=A0A4P9ZV66_9FUNG|nr:hypothetical protein BJ085DRAFT_30446 [Dimargaris cristalligena]|eukprot:RKP37467.1 hypothetical protein BJ085DRAFT_30446 [Dimargaris cristalligena]
MSQMPKEILKQITTLTYPLAYTSLLLTSKRLSNLVSSLSFETPKAEPMFQPDTWWVVNPANLLHAMLEAQLPLLALINDQPNAHVDPPPIFKGLSDPEKQCFTWILEEELPSQPRKDWELPTQFWENLVNNGILIIMA